MTKSQDAPRYATCRLPSSKAMSTVERVTDEENMPGIDRLLALTDGVVAIALTLLILQLQIPVNSLLKDDLNSASALWHALSVDGDGSELTSYLVSFVVIAQFWLVHHRILSPLGPFSRFSRSVASR